jgi:hypothetical protein
LRGDLAYVDASDMTHTLFVQGFVHRTVAQATDLALRQCALQSGVPWRMAQVHQRRHFYPLIMQIESREVTVIVTRQYHRAFVGFDRTLVTSRRLRAAACQHRQKSANS